MKKSPCCSWNLSCFSLALLLMLGFSDAFIIRQRNGVVLQGCKNRGGSYPLSSSRLIRSSAVQAKKGRGDDEDDDQSGVGMEAAFRELENLKSLDDYDGGSGSGGDGGGGGSSSLPSSMKKTQADEAFAKAMEDLDLKDFVESPPPVTPEKEVKVYQEMVSELEQRDEDALYSDVLSDMGSSSSSTSTPKSLSSIIPDLNSPTSVQDTQKFMDQALSEALAEAKAKAAQSGEQINTSNVLDSKEIMKEIEKIFDDANTKLLDGLEEIRQEQRDLVKKSSERSVQATNDKIEEDERRLAMAEANMKKMLAKVDQETKEVEKAIEELKQAQAAMDSDTVGQLAGLKSGGIVKQATLVGALLFSIRAFTDGVLFMGGDSSHMMPAAVQAVIALACFAAFMFLK